MSAVIEPHQFDSNLIGGSCQICGMAAADTMSRPHCPLAKHYKGPPFVTDSQELTTEIPGMRITFDPPTADSKEKLEKWRKLRQTNPTISAVYRLIDAGKLSWFEGLEMMVEKLAEANTNYIEHELWHLKNTVGPIIVAQVQEAPGWKEECLINRRQLDEQRKKIRELEARLVEKSK